MLEALVKKAASKIAISQSYDKEREAVVAYGMLAIVQMLVILFLSMFIGIVTHTVLECFIIYCAVGFLRKFTGGAHAGTMWFCILVSILTISIGSFLAVLLANLISSYLIVISFVVYGIIFLIVGLKAPVDNPKKPIQNPKKIQRLRIESLLFLTTCLALSALCVYLAYVTKQEVWYRMHFALELALVWQSFTLTSFAVKTTELLHI